MTHLILFDTNVSHAETVMRSLQGFAYAVTSVSDVRSMLNALRHADFDILILCSCHEGEWKQYLDQARTITATRQRPPRVICLARVYRGPQERLDAEQRGVRLVYER